MDLWEPPTVNQPLASQREPWQIQRPLVRAPPSSNVPPTRKSPVTVEEPFVAKQRFGKQVSAETFKGKQPLLGKAYN
jgi:hypothetical protein